MEYVGKEERGISVALLSERSQHLLSLFVFSGPIEGHPPTEFVSRSKRPTVHQQWQQERSTQDPLDSEHIPVEVSTGTGSPPVLR